MAESSAGGFQLSSIPAGPEQQGDIIHVLPTSGSTGSAKAVSGTATGEDASFFVQSPTFTHGMCACLCADWRAALLACSTCMRVTVRIPAVKSVYGLYELLEVRTRECLLQVVVEFGILDALRRGIADVL